MPGGSLATEDARRESQYPLKGVSLGRAGGMPTVGTANFIAGYGPNTRGYGNIRFIRFDAIPIPC